MNKKLKYIILFSFIFLIIDQLIKILLSNTIKLGNSINIINNFLNITLTHNRGAAFSILSGNRILLIIIGLLAFIGILYFVNKLEKINKLNILIYSLMCGGILGNLIDRILYGYVIDYISFKFGNYYFPIFNLADIFITLSALFIIISLIKEDLWK